MLNLGNAVSVSSTKTLAANTAATTSKKVAQHSKAGMMADTSCHHLSKKDLAYFSSEKFEKTLQLMADREQALKYGKLIASRKRVDNLHRAWDLCDAVIYVDIYDAHDDGFSWSYEEVKDLFKGYRSQALRELKSATGFNALFYRELAKCLLRKEEIRSFLKAMNKPILREKPIL